MKYLKTFELYTSPGTGQHLDYDVDDIVICDMDKFFSVITGEKLLKKGNKYKVLRIYQIPEDKFLKNPFLRVDVQDLETDKITKGWKSTDFKTDVEFDADKYNM